MLVVMILVVGGGVGFAVWQPAAAHRAWMATVAGAAQAWSAGRAWSGVAVRWGGRQVDHVQARFAPPPMGPDVMLDGAYDPADDAARDIGAIGFEGASLTIGETAAIRTRPGAIVTGADRMSLRQTWSEALKGGSAEQIEVRQVAPGKAEAPAPTALCDGQPVGWIALQPRGRALTVAAFGVGERPGPDMTGADLCGVWRYAKR